MKKIVFNVSNKKEGNVVSLIKEFSKISSRFQIDISNGLVAVENVDDAMVNHVIELIDQYYNISNVVIDNTSDETTSKENSQSVATDEQKAEANDDPKKRSTVIAPQRKEDLIGQKVKFKNEYVEELINRLMKTIYWAMYKMDVSEKEIGDFIWTSINEISMRYNPKGHIEYSVGDIVDCNYGTHLVGEVSGNHIPAIVCGINEGKMAYLVPIAKVRKSVVNTSYLTFSVPKEACYTNGYYLGDTALLDKGRYVRPERFHQVIGKVTPELLAKIRNMLKITFDFTSNS